MHILNHLPFPVDIMPLTEEELAQELKATTSGRVGKKRVALLLNKARESIGVREGLAAARLRLAHCLAEITFWQDHLTQTEAAMANTLALTGLSDNLLSIKGVGMVTAASFLGEIGDPDRYEGLRGKYVSWLSLTLPRTVQARARGKRGFPKGAGRD